MEARKIAESVIQEGIEEMQREQQAFEERFATISKRIENQRKQMDERLSTRELRELMRANRPTYQRKRGRIRSK